VQQNPQRPFVPHRTPKVARVTITVSEFSLYRPFVPGAQRDTNESIAPAMSSAAAAREPAVSSINNFLDTSSKAATTYPQERRESFDAGEQGTQPEELPPVEHFLDPMPIVEHFAPDTEGALSDAWPAASDESPPAPARGAEPTESGWNETDWQNFDWRAAAALGESPDSAASNAWATTDWDTAAPPPPDLKKSAADAIATALNQIAQRIRDGDPSAVSDPEKIAATLASLLGVRR
jgi:hypothetical protein